jgi:hypothetical protein
MCWDELFDAMWLCKEFGSRGWTCRGLVSVVGAMRAIEGCGVRAGFFGMRASVTQMATVAAHFGLGVGFLQIHYTQISLRGTWQNPVASCIIRV